MKSTDTLDNHARITQYFHSLLSPISELGFFIFNGRTEIRREIFVNHYWNRINDKNDQRHVALRFTPRASHKYSQSYIASAYLAIF